MSVFEGGVGAGGRPLRLQASVSDFVPQRSGRPLVGRAHSATIPQRPRQRGWLVLAGGALARLIVPVLLLVAVNAGLVVYGDLTVEGLGSFAGKPLSLDLVLMPLSLFVVHLTSRRYGFGYAFAQIVLSWPLALVAVPVLFQLPEQIPPLRIVLAWGAALFVAQMVAALVFDAARGPRWWTAPFFASLLAGTVLSLIAFPAALGGTDADWPHEMASYMGLCAAAALLLLIPYALVRPLVRPRPGFGGY